MTWQSQMPAPICWTACVLPPTTGLTVSPLYLAVKVIAGTDGRILDTLAGSYDGLIIESFSVGVLPNYGNDSFLNALSDWISAGKLVCMATQVTHEGSDMEVYQVGKVIKEKFPILESYNMTLEASVTKMMWVLGQTQDLPECRRLFYKTINHDLLFL